MFPGILRTWLYLCPWKTEDGISLIRILLKFLHNFSLDSVRFRTVIFRAW
jgi:hypothetical protein